MIGYSSRIGRRGFLKAGLLAGGGALLGCQGASPESDAPAGPDVRLPEDCADPFVGGALLGTVAFIGEGDPTMETLTGDGLDGRLYTDLSALGPDDLVTPTERFYVRTRASALLDFEAPVSLTIGGLTEAPVTLTLQDLAPLITPQGRHLLECSGNTGKAHFGLMSVGEWAGVSFGDLMKAVVRLPGATQALVSGFDTYPAPSVKSTPGASWVFTFAQLESAGAFFATELNGEPLPDDHGRPLRLLVPNWYGCTCIKWVREVTLVDDSEPSTPHMREFAQRTHQVGVPELASDYLPATLDQAAMPIRVEVWQVGAQVLHRVVGILWGGYSVTAKLVIRFAPEEEYVPVDICPAHAANDPWTLWSHAWTPPGPGTYAIQLQTSDPSVPKKRLDSGFYARTVTV